MGQGTTLGIPGGKTSIARHPAFPDGEIGPRPSPQLQSRWDSRMGDGVPHDLRIPGGGWGKVWPWGFPEGKRRWPVLRRFHAHNGSSPAQLISPIRVHSRFPAPTPKALWHTARGCADPGATPGPGPIAFPTPQGVVPFVPAGGCDKQGRNGIRFAGAEGESARNVCPISTAYTHITCHPFEPAAQPRWGC